MFPVLSHYDSEMIIFLETNASSYVSAEILSQYYNEGILHLISFFYQKHTPVEKNYKIYHEELGTILNGLEHWGSECEGSVCPIKILTDHKNMEYFMTSKLLNKRNT
jgi:hypothetical protein